MKKLIVLALAAAAIIPSISAKTITESRSIKAFDKLEVSSAVNVKYVQGTPVGLKITGSEEDVAKTKIKQTGGKLKIWCSDNRRMNFGRSRSVSVVVTTPVINEIELDGACSFTASRLGTNGKVDMEIDGASNVDITDLKAGDVKIECSGSSNIKIARSSTRRIDLEVSGASNVTIAGSTGYLDLECSGASKASLGNLSAKSGEVETSGASRATTHITNLRKADNSGASTHKNR